MPGRFLEQNQIGPFFEVLQRNYLEARASASVVLIEANIIAAHHSANLLCLVERRAQRPQQPFARHLQDVEAGPAGGWFQIRARIATKLNDLKLGVDEDSGRGITAECDAIRLALGGGFNWKSFLRRGGSGRGDSFFHRRMSGREVQPKHRGRTRFFEINLVLPVHRFKQLSERADRFGSPKEKKAVWFEGVMKRRDDLFLQTGFQVNQQIAATDQIEARERRIAQEILPRKHDHLPQRLADAETAVLLDKEPPQPFGRNVLHQALGVEARPGLLQQDRVEIRCENLQRGQT